MKKKIFLGLFAAIHICGLSIFTSCSKNNDEKMLGVDTTNRVDNYSDMDNLVESLPFSELQGISVGNAQDNDAQTGVTVFFFPEASMASAVVLGGGPASREVPLLDPQRNTQPLNALVFGGGSAYGMAAADGVYPLYVRVASSTFHTAKVTSAPTAKWVIKLVRMPLPATHHSAAM